MKYMNNPRILFAIT